MLRIFVIFLLSTMMFIGLSASVLDSIYGGGDPFPKRTLAPTPDFYATPTLEKVATADYPFGNVTVSESGQTFVTLHPEGRPPFNLGEVVNGEVQPLEIKLPEGVEIQSVLSIRLDAQNRLWILDFADHGSGQPRLLAMDITSREIVHQYDFPSDIAPLGSHLNDFQVDQAGNYIYIAEASILGLDPAVVVYDIQKKTARRLLEDHESVEPDNYVPFIEGEKMLMFGVFAIRPGVDSIALDRQNEWLYFAPVTDEQLYRVRVSDLLNEGLSSDELEVKVEAYATKTMSDGISIDNEGRVYLTDIEHSSIIRVNKDRSLTQIVRDEELRWPDGLSFGPDSYLYVTSSALQYAIAKPASYIAENGPYHLFRFKTDGTALAGH